MPQQEKGFLLSWTGVYVLIVSIRLITANICPILDCDEVYNYWEPIHYLNFGSGMQTWEYAPEYSLRTYCYIYPMYLTSFLLSNLFQINKHKVMLFYLLRSIQGGITGYCEVCFAQSLKDEKVAAWFLLFSIVSSGMFHASSALLPSTTVMQLWLVSYSYYNKNFVKEAIYWGLLSVLATGWPFCALLWVPLGVHVLWVRARKGYTMFIHTIMETIITATCIQLAVCIIDYSRYGQNKLVFPTWNILLYNLTSGGDELYGVEPISYYLKNLFLNFNFVSILGLIISPLILLFRKKSIFYLFPMFIWIIIVFPRPHKEERFLYPIYPSICYSASLFMKEILNTRKKKILLFLIIGNMVFFYVLFSVLRSTALSVYYMAPIHVYHFFYYYALDRHHPSTNNTLCVAGEWYRFPSSYFLPFNTKLSFLRSSFKGQLPQPFQANTGPFNDMNREEISRYGVIEDCDYLIDFANQYEEDEWEKIASFPFLNAEKTSFLSRIIYLSPIMEIWNKEKMPQFESYSLFRKISKKNTM